MTRTELIEALAEAQQHDSDTIEHLIKSAREVLYTEFTENRRRYLATLYRNNPRYLKAIDVSAYFTDAFTPEDAIYSNDSTVGSIVEKDMAEGPLSLIKE